MDQFCVGYAMEPWKTLAAAYPDETAYPSSDFRTEWGPIFHRGRLDGSARILLIGQDPGQHENVLRRILVGEAGRRVQGFLNKLGITRSYVLINALLYSVYGKNGDKYVSKPGVRDYRSLWIDAILASGNVQAVVTFGTMAKEAWTRYAQARGELGGLAVVNLTHPTFPESAGGSAAARAANTKKMLRQWNGALEELFAGITAKDISDATLTLYGGGFAKADKVNIPSMDLPAGIPRWMYDDDGWAKRVGASAAKKRRNITITVPEGVIR